MALLSWSRRRTAPPIPSFSPGKGERGSRRSDPLTMGFPPPTPRDDVLSEVLACQALERLDRVLFRLGIGVLAPKQRQRRLEGRCARGVGQGPEGRAANGGGGSSLERPPEGVLH